MASPGEEKRTEEVEYESESEESKFGLAMRRREASDDDDDNDNDKNDREAEARKRLVWRNRRFCVGSEDESGVLGGYNDDYEVSIVNEHEELGDAEVQVFEGEEERKHGEGDVTEEVQQRLEEQEKDLVLDPKFGAFYMHDDRFRGRGRRRHTLDERFKEPKGQEKWMHDKFEEMNLQARRTPEGYHPGQYNNKSRGSGHITANRYKPHGRIDDQNYSSRIVKGRGPIKYKPIMRSSNVNLSTKSKQSEKPQGQTSNTDMERVFSTRNKQYSKAQGAISNAESARIFSTENKNHGPFRSGKFVDMTSNTNSVGAFSRISDVGFDSFASEKHIFATNRSSSMQIFKSSCPKHFNSLTQKKDVQPEKPFGNVFTSAVPNNNLPKFNALRHVEMATNPIGRDKLHAGKSIHPVSENYITNLPFQSFLSWPNYMIESTQMMGQGGLLFSTMLSHPLTPPGSQINSVYPLAHSVTQQMPVESTIQPPLLVCTRQFSQCFEKSECQASAEALSPNSYESQTLGTHTVSKVAVSGEGIGTLQGMGRCSFPFAGIQVTTNGSQHGHGEPAVNMPVSECIPPLQSSVNPEMTWWPVFPAAADAVGGVDCSPINTTDGDNQAHSTGESSSLGAARYQG